MSRATTAVVLLVTLAVGCLGKGPVVYPFSPNNLLTCHVPNPFAALPGQPPTIPEVVPRLSLSLSVNGNRQWLPTASGFAFPNGVCDPAILTEFLGSDFNKDLTSNNPDTPPPRACDLLFATEGSANQQLRHIEVVQEPIDLLEDDGALVFNQTVDDITRMELDQYISFTRRDEFDTIARTIINNVNTLRGFEDLRIALCELTPQWLELPDNFFPKFIAQSTCAGSGCSIPDGLRCLADFRYSAFVTVLRWDCCYNHENLETQWECGWRKVQVPIFCDCTCSCNAQ